MERRETSTLPAMTAPEPNPRDSYNPVPLTVDETLEAISNSRRRFSIRFVDEMELPIHVDNLAEALAEIENEGRVDAQDRKTIYVALTQHHLDKLEALGAVVYDDRRKILMPSEATNGLANLIRYAESTCDPGL
jgi:hypothetical protein